MAEENREAEIQQRSSFQFELYKFNVLTIGALIGFALKKSTNPAPYEVTYELIGFLLKNSTPLQLTSGATHCFYAQSFHLSSSAFGFTTQ